jgi:hypothetical protein
MQNPLFYCIFPALITNSPNNMSAISDITDIEIGIVQSTLDERWGKNAVEPQVVDVEARLSKGDRELTECPALYWEQADCHFIIIKTDDSQYRTQFYYGNREQFGTSIPEYDNMGDCVLSLLRLQADHEITRAEEQDSE